MEMRNARYSWKIHNTMFNEEERSRRSQLRQTSRESLRRGIETRAGRNERIASVESATVNL